MSDPWKHRSKNMTCNTCIWWLIKLPTDSSAKSTAIPEGESLGRCRKHAPTLGGWPAVFSCDWCGDHKLNEG